MGHMKRRDFMRGATIPFTTSSANVLRGKITRGADQTSDDPSIITVMLFHPGAENVIRNFPRASQ